ncbi:hypothetical protein BTVI_10489 [Pitangus sulphuratus]|nr:hypothetical protein BTVI_10489 [Pitangus sulphuratus]
MSRLLVGEKANSDCPVQRWKGILQDAPVNIVSDSLYVVGMVMRIEGVTIKTVKNDRPGTTTFENSEFPLDVKESMFLLLTLPGLLNVVHTMFRVKKEISMEVIHSEICPEGG